MPEHLHMARLRHEPGSRMGEPGKARVTGNHKMSGRCCLLAIIRGTSIGRSIWETKNVWRPMWHGPTVKAAVQLSLGPLCYPACCAAVDVAGNCKSFIAVPVAACHDMSVGVIEEIADPANAGPSVVYGWIEP